MGAARSAQQRAVDPTGPDQAAAPGPLAARLRRCTGPAVVAGAAATLLVVVASVDPNEPGHYPTCPFLWLTGLACPGCGTLRALHALVHLDLARAVSLNVLTVVALALLAALWCGWLRRQWAGQPRTWLAPPWRLWGLLAVVVAFWVLRNLPATNALAP